MEQAHRSHHSYQRINANRTHHCLQCN